MKKQIISEEVLKMQKIAGIITESQLKEALETLNEDNLEVKKIARDLYSWFKKQGVEARLIASAPSGKSGGAGKIDAQSANKNGSAFIYYYEDAKTKQTVIAIELSGNIDGIQKVEKLFLQSYPNLEQYDRRLNKSMGIDMTGKKIPGAENLGSLQFRVKEKTTKKGGLVGNTPTKPAAQPQPQQ